MDGCLPGELEIDQVIDFLHDLQVEKQRNWRTMAEGFNRFGDDYLANHHLSIEQLQLIQNIRQCRTKILDGHKSCCNHCGHIKVHYNSCGRRSCGNRNCPGCQGVNKEKWILERKYDLLPVPYFHVVFTLPAQLRAICLQNQKLIYNVLFTSAWETLDDFSKDPKQKLQAKMGMIAVLHTALQTRKKMNLHSAFSGPNPH